MTAPVEPAVLDWLLEESDPAVRHLALRDLLGRPPDDSDVVAARSTAMRSGPIGAILAAQNPEGWWVKPGPGYGPKYTATTWQVSFLDQMGADSTDPRVRAACEYVLAHAQTAAGGFGALTGAQGMRPAPSSTIHCLNGNLLRSLIDFGWLDDTRVQASIDWEVGAILGEDGFRYCGYTTGPVFRCGANGRNPCAWGAVKAVQALGRIPADRRTAAVRQALAAGVEFLLSVDPATADYPTADGRKTSGSWFKLGFPLGYVCDVLQVLEALVAAGHAGDPRLGNAVAWLRSKRNAQGRWVNEYAWTGKMIVNVDRQGAPSKWVTLRACRVLEAVSDAVQ